MTPFAIRTMKSGAVAMLTLTMSLCAALGFSTAMLSAQSKLPAPKLEPAFEIHLALGKPTDVGNTTAAGMRRVTLSTGTIEGTGAHAGVKGKVLRGADYQIIRPDGLTELDAHYVVQMDNGDMLYITQKGMRHGPADIMAKLAAGENVDQTKIYFHAALTVETASKSLEWMARSIFVTVGERLPTEAVMHVYRVN